MTGFRFLRIHGIPIEAHWSWVLLFLVLVNAVIGRLGRPDIGALTMVGMAISCALLFFLSILLHELGHALWALRERWNVEKITLFGLGGLAWVSPNGPYYSARPYFRVVAAGPLVTVALIVLFGATERAGEALGWPRSIVDVAGLLTLGNFVILLFNLVPAMPLDGGQMLLAWLWRRSGSPEAASRILTRTGAVSIYLALGAGIVLLATGRLRAGYFVTVVGVQIPLMGWHYYRGAASVSGRPRRSQLVGDLIRRRGRNGPVVDATVRKDEAIELDPNTSLEDAFEQLPDVTDRGIVVEDGRVTGIVSRRVIAEALLEAADADRGRRDAPAT